MYSIIVCKLIHYVTLNRPNNSLASHDPFGPTSFHAIAFSVKSPLRTPFSSAAPCCPKASPVQWPPVGLRHSAHRPVSPRHPYRNPNATSSSPPPHHHPPLTPRLHLHSGIAITATATRPRARMLQQASNHTTQPTGGGRYPRRKPLIHSHYLSISFPYKLTDVVLKV